MWHWLSHHLGMDNGSGGYYLWWSGAGSDLSEVALLGAAAGMLHQWNCHERGCWRVGRMVTVEENGHHFRRCRRHHEVRHG